jgi:hypothetical protein
LFSRLRHRLGEPTDEECQAFRHCQLNQRRARSGQRAEGLGLCRHLGTRLLLPDPEGLRASASVAAGGHEVPAWAEKAVVS